MCSCRRQGLLTIKPAYALKKSTHFCKYCSTFFDVPVPVPPPKPKRQTMSLEDVFTEGPVPSCPGCGTASSVRRLVVHRPPYMSRLHVLRGQGRGTGLAGLAARGVVIVPKHWPVVDEDGRVCTHACGTCGQGVRTPPKAVRTDPIQVCMRPCEVYARAR